MSGWIKDVKQFSGGSRYSTKPPQETVMGIEAARAKLAEDPEKYQGIWFQSNMVDWPEDQQKVTMIARGHGYGVKPTVGGWATWEEMNYVAFGPTDFCDDYVALPDMNQYRGTPIEWYRPGRGEGCCDFGPSIKLIGEVDPNDIDQGGVGDCWLMSAISCLAEFPGTINKIFKGEKELNEEGKYTVKLFDVPSKQFVDVTVDDRLACHKNKPGKLLSARESPDAEMWTPILEKALCAHAGGWDHIGGGQAPFGWALLTGSMNSLTIKLKDDAWVPYKPDWDSYTSNSPHSGSNTITRTQWPDGTEDSKSNAELFDLLAEWDSSNFLLAASTCRGSDDEDHDGIVDGHAYSVISVVKDVCGKFDMILFRNPWGAGEYRGPWSDGGEMWDEHVDVKEALDYEPTLDDGQFWMQFSDALKYFEGFQVLLENMAPPAAPVKKRHTKKSPKHQRPKHKQITIGYMAGTWLHSKDGSEILVEVNDDSVSIIREGKPTKTYKTHQFVADGRIMFYGLVGSPEIEMNDEGAASDYIQWNNGVKWRRCLKPAGFVGKWLHSGGATIEISLDADTVNITHPISGVVAIDLADFVQKNVVHYKGFKGLPDEDWELITFNNGVTWTRLFGVSDLVGQWQHSRTNGMINITVEEDTSDYDSGTVYLAKGGGSCKEYTFGEFHHDGELHYFGITGKPNQQMNAIVWANGVVWRLVGKLK